MFVLLLICGSTRIIGWTRCADPLGKCARESFSDGSRGEPQSSLRYLGNFTPAERGTSGAPITNSTSLL